MAQVQLVQETCLTCQGLLKDPVTLPCGHSRCIKCVTNIWDEEEREGDHSCPRCRETFTLRPDLVKGTKMAALVEQLRKTGLKKESCSVEESQGHKPEVRHPEETQNREEDLKLHLSQVKMGHFTPAPQSEPKSRAELLQYSCDITLDPNTVNSQLLLSEEDRRATLMREEQPYPDHPDRFVHWRQVLSREGLTGRCYWEVEWKHKRVTVAAVYKNVSREGAMRECAFGFNDKSWALECNCSANFKFRHNSAKTSISGPGSSRIGVYLDHGAGVLSFYGVSETMTLLHRVQTTFTQPLHAGLWFSGYHRATAKCIKPEGKSDVNKETS